MRVINNIFYRRGLPVLGVSKCRHSGFECFRPLCCNPCVLFRAYGAAARKSGQRRSYRSCRSCRSCRSGRGGAGRRFWAVVPGGGWRGRTRRNRSVESGAAEVVPGLLFRAAVPGGGGVSDGGAGWLSRVVAQDGGGCVGRSRWAAEVSGGGGHVGRRMERPNGDGPGGVGDLLCRMRAVGACPCPCPCPCLPANRMSAAEKRRRNLSLPARKRIFEGH